MSADERLLCLLAKEYFESQAVSVEYFLPNYISCSLTLSSCFLDVVLLLCRRILSAHDLRGLLPMKSGYKIICLEISYPGILGTFSSSLWLIYSSVLQLDKFLLHSTAKFHSQPSTSLPSLSLRSVLLA